MGKLIANLITIGIALTWLGQLKDITMILMKGAASEQQTMLSLGKLNRSLIRGH